ncbi:MAG TPA: sigma-70 family RNA polymerase sigma factor [Oculatellaceae cyanobacterium]
MELTDGALIENFLKTKELIYFKTLIRRYQNRIYSASYRILGNAEEAEEIVQDTFVKVHQNLDKFKEHANFSSWLFRISHNLCMDMMRAKQRKNIFHLISFDPQASEDENVSFRVGDLPDETPNPAQQLDSEEQERMIAESITKLPDFQRTVLVLHDLEGFSYQEIAEITGASIGTVRSRLHYGRVKLRELLEPYFSVSTVSTASR